MSRIIILLGIIALIGACEAKEVEAPPATGTQATAAQLTAPEPVVTEEIPDDLRKQAAAEINADNADEIAAQLEAEIEAESQ